MGETGSEGRDTLSIRDNRTGREYEIDVLEGDVIRSMDLRQIKVKDSEIEKELEFLKKKYQRF